MQQDHFSNAPGQEPEREPNMQELTEKASIRAQGKAEKAAKRGTRLFYTIYGISVAVVVAALLCVLAPLRAWLVRYEAAQPEQQAQAVFEELFQSPDWADLYTKAGLSVSAFEKEDVFASYMESKVGSSPLSYMETSAGLSGDHKYIVRLGEEKIATFRLTAPNKDADIPDWELSTVELFFDQAESVTVEKLPGQTVYINGIALDDTYTTRIISTKAEAYLPEGVHGYQAVQQYVDGLLQTPTVTIQDAGGNPVELEQDSNGIWKPKSSATAMTEEEKSLILAAAKADAQYAIRAISKSQLGKYFDASSQVYTDIINTAAFLQSYQSYSFVEDQFQVEHFYRYNENLFSATVRLQMDLIRSNGTTKEIRTDKTYFFTKNSKGDILVTQYTNEQAQEQLQQVRLTFMRDGENLGTQMVESTARSLTLPNVTAPEGKVLQGWARRDVDDSGKVTMTILFVPGEDGKVHLNGEAILEPTTLHAVFANKEAE